MSYSSVMRAMQDPELRDRVNACALKQALNNTEFGNTAFGQQVLRNPQSAADVLAGPVAVDYEAQYETAVNSGRGAPGHDVDVITDANIKAAVQAHWPQDAV